MKVMIKKIRVVIAICALGACVCHQVMAQTWMGTTDSKWDTASNWSTGILPVGNYPTIIFDNAAKGRTSIVLMNQNVVRYLRFSSPACAAYTFGSNSGNRLWLTAADPWITINADVIQNQTVKARILLGNKNDTTVVSFRNYSTTADFIVEGHLERATYTGDTTVRFDGVGDMSFLGGCVTNGLGQIMFRNLNSGTITLGGYNRINRLYNNNTTLYTDDTHLELIAGAELFLDSLDSNHMIYHEDNGLIDGAGTLRFGCGANDEPARVYTETGSTLTIKTPLTCAGGFDKLGDGMLTLGGTCTYSGATIVSEGTLLVNGSHTGGDGYAIASGAMLGGTGTVTLASGTVDLLAGASLVVDPASGGTNGTLTVSSLTLNDNSVTLTDISSFNENVSYPILTCTGTITGSLAPRIADSSWLIHRRENTFYLRDNAGIVIVIR